MTIARILLCAVFFSALFAQSSPDFSGAVFKEKSNGFEIYVKPDGTILKKNAELIEEIQPDKTIIRSYYSGVTETVYPDGRKLIVDRPNGERRYIAADGSEKKITFKGRTPLGDPISGASKVIQKAPLVQINYIPERSDELLENDLNENNLPGKDGIASFYDELAAAVRANLSKEKYESGDSIMLNISYIRYAQYGYCYNKAKNVTVEILTGSGRRTVYSFDSHELRNAAKRLEQVKKITEEFSKLK